MTVGWILIAAQAAAIGAAPQARATMPVECVSAAAPCDSIAPAGKLRRNSLSLSGLPGLIHVPAAATLPSGAIDLAFDGTHNQTVFPDAFFQRNGFIAFGFLPRLTVSGRGTVADTSGVNEVRDLSANAQLLLFTERRAMPAIAVGVQDVGHGATPYFPSRYLVASKTLFGHARLSAGYGSGRRLLDGPFGSAEVWLGPWVTALGEYDGERYNGGLRIFPFPSFADRIGLQPTINVVRKQHVGTAYGIGVRTWLGGKRETGGSSAPIPAAARAPERAATDRIRSAPGATTLVIQQRLVGFGFENVRVELEPDGRGQTVAIEYENRRFNRSELDALGIVMGVAAMNAADSVTRMRVTIRRVDVPVMTIESSVAAFGAFVNGHISDNEFANQLHMTSPGRSDRGPTGAVGAAGAAGAAAVANSSRFKLDIVLRPRVETTLLTDLGIFDTRVSLRPNALMQLGPGLVLNAQRAIPVSQTQRYPGQIDDLNADRLLLHQALRVPSGAGRGADAITQFSAGRYGHERVGFSNEVDLSLADGRVSLRSMVAVFGKSFGDLDHTTALATVRVRRTVPDLTASVTAGRFLNGDSGAQTELSRVFGATELGFYVRTTDRASLAGVRIELPLTPSRELPPARIRPRLPDAHGQAIQSVILDPLPALRRDVGLLLATDHVVELVFRARDRLQPATVRGHVEMLRDAVRRWLEPATFPDRTYPDQKHD